MRTLRVCLSGVSILAVVCCLAACQKTTKVAVENRCGGPIEVDVNGVADPVGLGYKHEWRAVPQGETASLRSAPDPVRRVYVWVRLPGSAVVPEPLVFEPSDLESSDHKVVAVIVCDLCPGQ